jgi:hypothetical protein
LRKDRKAIILRVIKLQRRSSRCWVRLQISRSLCSTSIELQELISLRAERHADSQLRSPLSAEVGQHSVQAHGGKKHGQNRKDKDEGRAEARIGQWHTAGAVQARAWLGGALRGDTHLLVDVFRNLASRSRGSYRRDSDAVGGSGSGLPHSRMACFSVRSNASAPNGVGEVCPPSAQNTLWSRSEEYWLCMKWEGEAPVRRSINLSLGKF